MASSGHPHPTNRILQMVENLQEITETLEAIKGKTYSRFVGSIFSLGQLQLAFMEVSGPDNPVIVLMGEAMAGQISNIIASYAEATMKQDPHFADWTKEERQAKTMAYVKTMMADCMMLVKKVEER